MADRNSCRVNSSNLFLINSLKKEWVSRIGLLSFRFFVFFVCLFFVFLIFYAARWIFDKTKVKKEKLAFKIYIWIFLSNFRTKLGLIFRWEFRYFHASNHGGLIINIIELLQAFSHRVVLSKMFTNPIQLLNLEIHILLFDGGIRHYIKEECG